jgi:hypothetical protein
LSVNSFEAIKSRGRLNNEANLIAIQTLAGIERDSVEFIDENGGGPAVRLRRRHQKES